MSILVTSATGKVSQEVVRQLAAAGVPFRAGSSDPDRAQKLLGVPVTRLNYLEPTTFTLTGIKRIFLLHPLYEVKNEHLYAFIDAAVEQSVEQIVFMSALGADEQPTDPIHLVGQYLVNSGLKYTLLYPNWFMQNFHTSDLGYINQRNQLMMPSGESRLSFIDTRDIAAVAAHILIHGGHEGQSYVLTGGETFSYGEVAAMLSDITGRSITHHSPSVEEVLHQMRQHGAPADAVDFMAWLYRDMERGLTAQITPHVEQILGRPPLRLAQYMQEYANVWKV